MLAVTDALQGDEKMLKLISAYQPNEKKLDIITNGMDSAFNSKDISPGTSTSTDNGRSDSCITGGEASPSECDVNMEAEQTEGNAKTAPDFDKTLESDMEVDGTQTPVVKTKDLPSNTTATQEKMPDLQAQTSSITTPSTASPLLNKNAYPAATPPKEYSFKKRYYCCFSWKWSLRMAVAQEKF